jgi:hypothetical protein
VNYRRRPRPVAAGLATALILVTSLAGCSFGIGDDAEPGAQEGVGGAAAAGAGPAAPAPTTSAPASGPQVVKVGKTAWYAGLKLTFEEVTYDPEATSDTVTAKVLVENLSGRDYQPSLPVLFSTGTQQYDGDFVQRSTVGAQQSSRLDLAFRADNLPTGLAGTSFVIGRGTETQSTVPVIDGELIANEPRSVLSNGKKIAFRDTNVWFKQCEVRADLVPNHYQAKRDHVVLACVYDVQFSGTYRGGHFWGEENLRLKLPDGTVIGSTQRDSAALSAAEIVPDQYVAFQLPAAPSGAYALQIIDIHAGEKAAKKYIREIPVTL